MTATPSDGAGRQPRFSWRSVPFFHARLLILFAIVVTCGALRAETPDEIFARHRKALRVESTPSTSIIYRGAVSHGTSSGTFTWSLLRPGFFRDDVLIPGTRDSSATDGHTGWSRLPNGVTIGLQHDEIDLLRLMTLLWSRAYLNPTEAGLTLERANSIDGKTWRVTVSARDMAPFELFFDARTWLLARIYTTVGRDQITIDLGDYHKVAGVKYPYQVTLKTSHDGLIDETIYSIRQIDLTTPLEPGIFQRPTGPGATAKLPPGQASEKVPLRVNSGNNQVFVKASIDGGLAQWFVLDSSARVTVIDRALARRLKLPVVDTLVSRDFKGPQRYELHPVDGIAVGGLELGPTVVTSVDLSALPDLFTMPVVGILGMDLFDRVTVELRYADGTVTFHDPARFAGNGAVLPIDAQGHVEIQVNGRLKLPVLLDTGRDTALNLPSAMVEREGLAPPVDRRLPAGMAGLDGEMPAYQGKLESVQVGETVVPDVVATFGAADKGPRPPDEVAILGNQILQRFNVTFDFPHRQVRLEPGPWLKKPFSYNRTGLTFAPGGDFKVEAVRPGVAQAVRRGDTIVAVMTDKGWSRNRVIIYSRLGEPAGTRLKVQVRRGGAEQEAELELRDWLE